MAHRESGTDTSAKAGILVSVLQTLSILLISASCVVVIVLQPFGHELSVSIVAILTWPLVQLIRNWRAWGLIGIRRGASPSELMVDETWPKVAFVLRKSVWWVLPVVWLAVIPYRSIGSLFTLPVERGWIPHAIGAALVALYLGSFVVDCIKQHIPMRVLARGFILALAGAGLPEELLIVGFIAGNGYRLLVTAIAPIWAFVIAATVVEAAFSISHFPNVVRNRRLYAEHMTGREDITLGRSFVQMSLLSAPGLALYFATGSVWYPVLMHTLLDLPGVLPKDDGSGSPDTHSAQRPD